MNKLSSSENNPYNYVRVLTGVGEVPTTDQIVNLTEALRIYNEVCTQRHNPDAWVLIPDYEPVSDDRLEEYVDLIPKDDIRIVFEDGESIVVKVATEHLTHHMHVHWEIKDAVLEAGYDSLDVWDAYLGDEWLTTSEV